MKFCTNCGAKLEENVKFCTECGTKIERTTPAPQPEPVQEPIAAPQPEPVVVPREEYIPTPAPQPKTEVKPAENWEAAAAASNSESSWTPASSVEDDALWNAPPAPKAEPVREAPAPRKPIEPKKGGMAPKKKSSNKLWIIIAAAVIVVALIVGAIFIFGGKDQGSDADLGKYTSIDGDWVELLENGKAKLNIMDEEYSGKWTLDGEKFVLKQGGDKFEGTLKDGELKINIAGTEFSFSTKKATVSENKTPTVSKPADKTEATKAVVYKAESASVDGETLDADFLKLMGDCYLKLNGDGTGMFNMFGDMVQVKYDDKAITADDLVMPYTIDGDKIEVTSDDGTVFYMKVTTEEFPIGSASTDEPAIDEPETDDEMACTYSVFDGIYRAKLKNEAGGDTFVEVTGYNDFIIMEFTNTIDGSIYSFHAEELWPNEDEIFDDDYTSVYGVSQTFSSMAMGDAYDLMPKNRCITLTDDGMVLNYDDSDAEYFERDNSFEGGHTAFDDMKEQMKSFVGDIKPEDSVAGNWTSWSGWEAGSITFNEDGTMEYIWKTPGNPVDIYRGVWGVEAGSDYIRIMAEKLGEGTYPYVFTWEWDVDEYDCLAVKDVDGEQFGSEEGECSFWREDDFYTYIDQNDAMGYVQNMYSMSGTYTDKYGTEYYYIYNLPQFTRGTEILDEINTEIFDLYNPIIDEEVNAMKEKEFLSYDYVDWESNVYDGILMLHVYAITFDWEEHSIYYFDLETGERVYADELLDRLDIDADYFLETVRNENEAIYKETFKELSDKDKEAYGYYDMLEWTVSDDAVNLSLPIFVDRNGHINVYVKIGSLAGSGIIWDVITPFAE